MDRNYEPSLAKLHSISRCISKSHAQSQEKKSATSHRKLMERKAFNYLAATKYITPSTAAPLHSRAFLPAVPEGT